jgi:hypothetical protein
MNENKEVLGVGKLMTETDTATTAASGFPEGAGETATTAGGAAAGVQTARHRAGKQTLFLVGLMLGCVLLVGATASVAFATTGGADAFEQLILVGNQDGTTSYSRDGGVTWTEGVPDDVSVSVETNGDEVFSSSSAAGQLPALRDGFAGDDGVESSLAIRTTYDEAAGEQLTEYSTDGGQTWSTEQPAGTETTVDANGVVTTQNFSGDAPTGTEGARGLSQR